MGAYNLLTQSVLIIMGLLFLVSALAIFGVAFLWSIHRDSKKQARALRGIHQLLNDQFKARTLETRNKTRGRPTYGKRLF